jgi:hypothetical protein
VEEWRDVLVPVVCAVCSSVAVTVKKKKEAILFTDEEYSTVR